MPRLNERNYHAEQMRHGNVSPERLDLELRVAEELQDMVLAAVTALREVLTKGSNPDRLRAVKLLFEANRITGHTSVTHKKDRDAKELRDRLRGPTSTGNIVDTLRQLPPQLQLEIAADLKQNVRKSTAPPIEVPTIPARDGLEDL